MKQESNIINSLISSIKLERDYKLISTLIKASNKKEYEELNILYKLYNGNIKQLLEIYLSKEGKIDEQ